MKLNHYIMHLIILFTTLAGNTQEASYEIPIRNSTKNNVLKTDGLIQPHLDDFLKLCKKYNIDYSEKLFKLKEIAIVDSLSITPKGGALGMLVRDNQYEVEKIIFSWMTLLDDEILRVVAYHEFGHYFLGYKHICDDCTKIMAKVNSSYFDIVKDWDYHVEELFKNSPEYIKKQGLAQN